MSAVSALSDVLAWREPQVGRLHRTPLLGSRSLSEEIGGRVLLKAELFQKTGSFKPRGMVAKLASLSEEERARGVVTWSAGNAAQGLAYAASLSGVSCRVFMWRGANPRKVAAARAYGAEVDLAAQSAAQAYERALAFVEEAGAVFCHPFDDPVLQAGHGSLGLEIVEEEPDVDLVVVPVGGGGLLAGVAAAVKGLSPQARVVGVEPEGAPALWAALSRGEIVRVEPRTIADGLAAPLAGERALAACRAWVDEVVLVSDEEIAAAMRFLYERAKLACEPAGAAAVAALRSGKAAARPGGTAVAVVSGGNADPRVAAAILAQADET